jgi:hypothetical protein
MTRIRLSSTIAATMLASLLHAAPGHAQFSKSWIANNGSDGNPCTLAAPCATLQHAHDVTPAGAEIGVLNAGDYGQVFITKSIFVTNDGSGEAGIFATSGGLIAVRVNVGSGEIVGLRGLVMEGGLAGNAGLSFLNGSALHVQNCVIKNFQGNEGGIIYQPIGNSQLFVSDTIIFNNGSVADTAGITIRPLGTGVANVVLDRVHLENNVVGLQLDASLASSSNGIHAVLRDSVVSGNASNGILAFTQAGAPAAFLLVDRSTIVNNAGNGIFANGPGATVLLKASTLTRNGAGVSTANSGQLISYGNNRNNNNLGPEGTATGMLTAF